MPRVYLFAGLFLMVALTRAQEPAPGDSTIRAEVPLVLVPVSVTDAKGDFIEGLTPLDFDVLVDGKARPFRLDGMDALNAPVSLVVAVQSSGISAAALAKLQKVGSLFGPLVAGEGGEVAVMTFDCDVKVRQDFTSDPELIVNAFRGLQPGDPMSGRMIDAVMEGIRMLRQRSADRRRVIFIIGETRDRGSKKTVEDAVTLAVKDDVAIYALSYSAYAMPFTSKPGDAPETKEAVSSSSLNSAPLIAIFTELARLGKINAADALTAATGGDHESFLMQKTLERTIAGIGREIHEEYVVSFPPAKSDAPGFHTIEVKLTDGRHAKVRARTGYWRTGGPE
ncbi:MAG: VWA domain-containing protein [Bryobacteraceae bacterium]